MIIRVFVLAPIAFLCAGLALASPPTPADLEHARRVLADGILFDGHAEQVFREMN